MAKQTGIHGLKGKVDGMSYYSSKNGGKLVRKINEGLGQRVKSSREYLNTRKNNAEFGMCGDFAGSIIKPFSLRWRFILDSIATGKMVKILKELVALDAIDAWGERVLKNTYFNQIRAAFNSFSKNEMILDYVNAVDGHVTYSAAGTKIHLSSIPELSEDTKQELLGLGANYFMTKVFALQANVPQFDANSKTYGKSDVKLVEVFSLNKQNDIALGSSTDLFGSDEGVVSISPVDTATAMGAFAVVFLPCRKVGSSISILQQYCSAYIAPVTAAA